MKEKSGFFKRFIGVLTAGAVIFGVYCLGFGAGNGYDLKEAGGKLRAAEDLKYMQLSAATGERSLLDSYSDVYEAVRDAVVSINVTFQVTTSSGSSGSGFDSMIPWFNENFGFSIPEDSIPDSRGYQIEPPQGAGSGIIFHEDEENVYIVTNYHVVDGVASCQVSLDDEIMVPAHYIGGDEASDIAVLSVSKADAAEAGVEVYAVAVFGDSDAMEIGDQVMAVGNANGSGKSASLGIVSAKERTFSIGDANYIAAIQTDAAINKGNSGGALVNMYGEVIGINAAKLSATTVEGVGYAIPSNGFMDIVEDIVEDGEVDRPFLGIEGTNWLFNGEGYPDVPETGVEVVSVIEGSAAEEMGLEEGDIIVGFNGSPVTTMEELQNLIKETSAGDKAEVEIVRLTVSQSRRFGAVLNSVEAITLTGTIKNMTQGPSF
ncbi:MAG: trypsin-like peptidase domain-containing protein [Clostridiales bacterium]|jgi:serine protease Do|nr:trypsin-like peptidase domain-containing protein [Clostridiales bacterium]